jgi:DNA-binding PucR family transcriptional regulator
VVPPSEAVGQICARLMAQADTLARAMVERYREEIADYRLADAEFVYQDVQAVTRSNLEAVLRSLVGDDSAVEATLVGTRERGAARVRQGISLDSFLHAARLFGQLLWEAVLEEADPAAPGEREAALEMAVGVMRYVDRMSVAAAEGFLNEVQSQWTDREVVRRDLLEDLISGRGDSERVRELARSLKLALADRYVAIVARGEVATAHESPDHPLAARVALRRVVEAARARLRPALPCLLVGMRQGEVVALYPVAGPGDMDRVVADATAFAAELADADVRVGVGGNHPGLAALADSYAEARDAAEIAGARGRVAVFDQVLIDHVVRSTPHAERILDTTLRPLLDYDARRQAELVATLRAYVSSGFNLTRAAELLNVHPNTVVYRLRRIRELSGRDPQDADDLLLLFFGLKLLAASERSSPGPSSPGSR